MNQCVLDGDDNDKILRSETMKMDTSINSKGGRGFLEGIDDTSDLPSTLIATNLDSRLFSDHNLQEEFEDIFRQFDDGNVIFQYLKSFKRARITFSNPSSAAQARIQCQQRRVGDTLINCYYSQQDSSVDSNDSMEDGSPSSSSMYLKPPPLEKQFLISPPASPPVGWEPQPEATPLINIELLAALSKLAPEKEGTYTLHPGNEDQPGIVVHICDDGSGGILEHLRPSSGKIAACPTPRPPTKTTDSQAA